MVDQARLFDLLAAIARHGRAGLAFDKQGDRILLKDPQVTETPARLVAQAVRAGLVSRKTGRLRLLAPARACLARALAAGDTPFADQHREIGLLAAETGRRRIKVNRDCDTLSGLRKLADRSGRPWFSRTALAAGHRFAADFARAGLTPRLTMSWLPRVDNAAPGPFGASDSNPAMLDARQRFARAARAIGPDLADIAIDACCFDKGLEQIEAERVWPARSAKVILRLALLALDRHYHPPAPGRKGRIESWIERDCAGVP